MHLAKVQFRVIHDKVNLQSKCSDAMVHISVVPTSFDLRATFEKLQDFGRIAGRSDYEKTFFILYLMIK